METRHRAHTAQELFRFSKGSPGVQEGLRKSFRTLARYADRDELDTWKAIALLMNNVRDAARYYVQYYGLKLDWPRVFPMHERYGCAALFLRQFDNWYPNMHNDTSDIFN